MNKTKDLEKAVQVNLAGMVNHYYDELDFFKNMELSAADKERIIKEAQRRIRKRRMIRGTALIGAGVMLVVLSRIHRYRKYL